jgi:hypothetical protein
MTTLRIFLVCTLSVSLFAADDPFVGIWKFEPDSSKAQPGAPHPMMGTVQVEPSGRGLKSTTSTADTSGVTNGFTFDCPLDGTTCKVTTAIPAAGTLTVDTISLRRTDERTITATATKKGKIVYTDQRVVSADGKTMTVTRQGVTQKGTNYRSTITLVRLR